MQTLFSVGTFSQYLNNHFYLKEEPLLVKFSKLKIDTRFPLDRLRGCFIPGKWYRLYGGYK